MFSNSSRTKLWASLAFCPPGQRRMPLRENCGLLASIWQRLMPLAQRWRLACLRCSSGRWPGSPPYLLLFFLQKKTGVNLGSISGRSGGDLGSHWARSGVNLGSLWVHLGSVWCQSGIHLGKSGVDLGLISGRSGVNLGSIWGPSGVHLGSIWGQSYVNMVSIWCQSSINLEYTHMYVYIYI